MYNSEKKRNIILKNCGNSEWNLKSKELKKKSIYLKKPFFVFYSSSDGCGDKISLLINRTKHPKECFFSADESCLITISVANILSSFYEKKENNKKTFFKILDNFSAMIKKKKYKLNDFKELEIFKDINEFPNRIECVNLVIRSFINVISNYKKNNIKK